MGSSTSPVLRLPLIERARAINGAIAKKVAKFHADKIVDMLLFDHLIEEIRAGFEFFCIVTPVDLATRGNDNAANARMLHDLKQVCNIPMR